MSVVIPCYNYARYLPAAVSSALDQPGVDVEVIIAENGSTDDSLKVAKELANADHRIRVLTRPENVPYLVNFNDGLRNATGEYSVLLCADDLLTPGSLTRSTALMEARPDVNLTYGHCPTFDQISPSPRTAMRSWSIWSGEEWLSRLYRGGRNVIRNPEALVRMSAFRTVGGYNPDYPASADMLLWMQLAAHGGVGRINGPDQGFYRIHGQNMHLNSGEGWLEDLGGLCQAFETPLTIDSPNDVDMVGLVSSARQALALRAVHYACDAFDTGDADDRLLGDAYASFAVDTWPEIKHSRRWRAVQVRQASTPSGWQVEIAKRRRTVRAYVGGKVSRQWK